MEPRVTLTHTFVRVYNERRFADPYKICNACGGWITGEGVST